MGVVPVQLLLRTREDGSEALDLVENPSSLPPDAFETADGSTQPARFGTEDLVRLTQAFREHGYRVTHFDIRDSRFQPLGEDDEAMAEASLLKAVRDGEWKSLLEVVYGPARDVYVVAIEVRTPTGSRFRIDRNGAVRSLNLPANRIFEAFEGVWERAESL